MKKTTLTTLFLITLTFLCNAQKTWSVSKVNSQKADFSEIQDAIDAASPGDYIYIYPSIYDNGFVLRKQLIIVGPGYFLGENNNTQINKLSAKIKNDITISTNAEGSIITGLEVNGHTLIQNAKNIFIKRNHLTTLEITGSNDIKVKQNYINGDKEYSYNKNYTINVKLNSFDIIISNNYISNDKCLGGSDWWWSLILESNSFVSVKNNVIYGHLDCSNVNFENNIFRGTCINNYYEKFSNCSFTNNIAYDGTFGNTNGNQASVSMSSVFLGASSNQSTDGQWQLKSSSPAKSAGINGVDCGMFGGSEPYILSGIPDIPTIYFFEAPDGGSKVNGLPVHVKIKSRQ